MLHNEQYSRRCNLKLKGVIETDSENVTELVAKVGTAIEETVLPEDIEACHRVPTRNAEHRHIIVQFKSRQKRDQVLEKAKKKRITNGSLGLCGQPGVNADGSSPLDNSAPVFVNEHLCQSQKRLLSLAIAKKRETNWRYVWTQNGKILARKSDCQDCIHIDSVDDLSKIS